MRLYSILVILAFSCSQNHDLSWLKPITYKEKTLQSNLSRNLASADSECYIDRDHLIAIKNEIKKLETNIKFKISLPDELSFANDFKESQKKYLIENQHNLEINDRTRQCSDIYCVINYHYGGKVNRAEGYFIYYLYLKYKLPISLIPIISRLKDLVLTKDQYLPNIKMLKFLTQIDQYLPEKFFFFENFKSFHILSSDVSLESGLLAGGVLGEEYNLENNFEGIFFPYFDHYPQLDAIFAFEKAGSLLMIESDLKIGKEQKIFEGRVVKNLIHEFQHILDYFHGKSRVLGTETLSQQPDWLNLSWRRQGDRFHWNTNNENIAISSYGETNPREDFAVHATEYILNPKKLKSIRRDKFKYLSEQVFDYQDFSKNRKISYFQSLVILRVLEQLSNPLQTQIKENLIKKELSFLKASEYFACSFLQDNIFESVLATELDVITDDFVKFSFHDIKHCDVRELRVKSVDPEKYRNTFRDCLSQYDLKNNVNKEFIIKHLVNLIDYAEAGGILYGDLRQELYQFDHSYLNEYSQQLFQQCKSTQHIKPYRKTYIDLTGQFLKESVVSCLETGFFDYFKLALENFLGRKMSVEMTHFILNLKAPQMVSGIIQAVAKQRNRENSQIKTLFNKNKKLCTSILSYSASKFFNDISDSIQMPILTYSEDSLNQYIKKQYCR